MSLFVPIIRSDWLSNGASCRGITALGTMDINATTLMTGLRLTGFSVGFILKDMFSNVLSSFLILFYEPFGINDRITVSNVVEKVIDIHFRYTIL